MHKDQKLNLKKIYIYLYIYINKIKVMKIDTF